MFALLEESVVEALGGVASLATVKGCSWSDRGALVAALGRERLPAAYVMVAGRDAGDAASKRSGPVGLSVRLASRSRRNADDARLGGVDVAGVFELAGGVAALLADRVIDSAWWLCLVQERPVSQADGLTVWEQRYEAHRLDSCTLPTFGGVVLAGADSVVRVVPGTVERASSMFTFPGIDGVFEWSLGVRGREIVWRGQLRAADDAAMNAIEASIEGELRGGAAKEMTDAFGRTFSGCVAKRLALRGARERDLSSGQVVQDFELTFAQLGAE